MSLPADLVGPDIMSGDPAAVSLLGKRMAHLADDVNGMRDKFSARYLGGIWEGQAFDVFAKTLEDVPKDLERVGASYTMASQALASYSSALAEVQQTARALARQATDAQSRVNAAEGERTRAKREVKLAKSAQAGAADPVAMHDAQRRLQRAASALGAAEARYGQACTELAGVKNAATFALTMFDDEVRLCCQRLHDASEVGIQNTTMSAWNRHVAEGPALLAVLLSPITFLVQLPEHIKALCEDTHDLAAWRGVLDAIGTAVLVATVVVLAIGTGGLAVVALGVVGAAVAGTSLWVDTRRVVQGDISSDVLVGDSFALGASLVPGGRDVGKFAPVVMKALRTSDNGWRTKLVKYGTSGAHMRTGERLDGLQEASIQTYVPEALNQTAPWGEPIPLHVRRPCVVTQPGLGASPLGVIRHTRPITPRPIVLTGGY